MFGKSPNGRLRQLRNLEALHGGLAQRLDPHLSRPVDADLDDVRVL